MGNKHANTIARFIVSCKSNLHGVLHGQCKPRGCSTGAGTCRHKTDVTVAGRLPPDTNMAARCLFVKLEMRGSHLAVRFQYSSMSTEKIVHGHALLLNLRALDGCELVLMVA